MIPLELISGNICTRGLLVLFWGYNLRKIAKKEFLKRLVTFCEGVSVKKAS